MWTTFLFLHQIDIHHVEYYKTSVACSVCQVSHETTWHLRIVSFYLFAKRIVFACHKCFQGRNSNPSWQIFHAMKSCTGKVFKKPLPFSFSESACIPRNAGLCLICSQVWLSSLTYHNLGGKDLAPSSTHHERAHTHGPNAYKEQTIERIAYRRHVA